MINKRILLSLVLIFAAFTAVIVADKNFVAVLNGSDTVTVSSSKSSAFVGQATSYDTKESVDYISRSAFASSIRSSASLDISFTNNTGTDTFSDIIVPLNVTIRSNAGNINKIRYQIWQGEDVNFDDRTTSPEQDYTDFTAAPIVTFSSNVSFSEGKSVNYFRVYAQDTTTGSRWSANYIVKLSTALSDTITFTAPDRLTGLATIDPMIESTAYAINLTSATISLYSGSFASGTPIFEVKVSSDTNPIYKMYDTNAGKISFLYSDMIEIYNEHEGTSIPTTLTNNQVYTLKLVTSYDESKTDTLTFTALSGGVADILTYPSPFNPKKEKIKLRYLLAKDAYVTIKIYDKAGKFVSKVIQSEFRSAGTNEDEWDGMNYAGNSLATGPYICEVIAKASDGEHRRYTAFAIVNR